MEKDKVKKEKINLTIGEKLKDERSNRHLTIEELCGKIEKECGFIISKSEYNKIESEDFKRGFSYIYLIPLARYFNISVDYLLGITEYNTLDIDERNACEYIGLNKETIQALHFWSKRDELKAMKDVVSEVIKKLTPDFIKAFFDYRSDEYCKERIIESLLKIYCEKNKLKNIASVYDLSPQDRFILDKIINAVLDDYGIDTAQSSFKFEKMLKELFFNMQLDKSILDYRNYISDEDIMIAYDIITRKHDYKKEYDDISTGIVNKNYKSSIKKKLF